jgi:hypothetical protein
MTLFLACLFTGRPSSAAQPNSAASQVSNRASVIYGRLPLSFEPNLGQTGKEVQWLARGPQYTLFLSGADAVLELNEMSAAGKPGLPPAISSSALRMSLLGAKAAERESGEEPQQGRANYFTGNDPSKWQKNVPMYGKVRLNGVYPGIDLVYYGKQGQLEYDFVVAPGADASAIRLNFDGAEARLADDGDLVLPVTGGGPEVRFHKPVVYQMKGGARQPVDGSFAIGKNRQVSFKLGGYDKSRELIIDPTLLFVGTLGSGDGNAPTVAYGMAVDSSGEMILTGLTGDVTFPVTSGALQTTCNTISPVDNNLPYTRCMNSQASSGFVTKISADGTSLVYSTYLHGLSGNEYGDAVATDAAGDAIVLGATSSNDFPVTADAFQSICQPYYPSNPGSVSPYCNGFFNGGGTEYTVDGPVMFIAKLNPGGSALLYSTFFGGTSPVYPVGLALDSSGNMYFSGFVQAAYTANSLYPNPGEGAVQFPTTAGAFQSNGLGEQAATLSVLDVTGHTLLYSTLLGPSTGGDYVQPLAIAVGQNGIAAVGGQTNSAALPTTPGSVRPSCVPNPNSTGDCYGYTGFVSVFDTTQSGSASLAYSTYIGGAEVNGGNQYVQGLAFDGSNNLFVTGNTRQNNYPTTSGVYQTSCGSHCGNPYAFLTKLSLTASSYIWSTLYGGTNGGSQTFGYAINLDAKGRIYLYGYNNGYSWDLPLVNPLEAQNGSDFAFVATFSPDATQLLFATPLFESCCSAYSANPINNNGMALDSNGFIYAAGYGNDAGKIVTTTGTYATKATGPGNRTFFAKISPVLPETMTTLTIAPTTAAMGQNVTFTATVAGTTQTTPVPTGTVTLSNGNTSPATTLGTITLGAGGSGTFSTTSLAPGTYSVTAAYSGDSNYDVSVSAAQTLTVTSLPATTTTLTIAPTGALTYGQTETLTATVTQTGGGTPTGTVTFTEGATTLGTGALNGSGVATLSTMLPIGAGNLVAAYGGSSGSAASASTSLMVTVSMATLTVTAASASRVVGVANPTLTGTVTGAVNGDTFTATYSTTATIASPPGSYPITPSVTGTNIADYNVNLVNGTLTVTPPTATTTKLASSAATTVVGTSLTFTATVTGTSGTPAPTGTVTFKDGATTIGMGALSGAGVATYTTATLAAATHTITASYGGDTSNAASVSSVVSVVVSPPTATTTTLSSSSASVVVGASVTLTATVTGTSGTPSPTGMVTFMDGTTALGTGAVNGSGVATYTTTALATGSHTLTASYGGDTSNAASNSSSVMVAVWPGAPAFTVTLNPPNGSFQAGTNAVITVTVTSVNGFSTATNLSCGDLPKNTVCNFSSPSVTPIVAGTATSTLTIETDKKPSTAVLGADASRTTSDHAPFRRPVAIAGALAGFLLLPLLGARNRRLRRLLLTLSSAILVAVLATMGMTGCGGGPTTPKGTYQIQVNATAGGLSESATYSLTVQ